MSRRFQFSLRALLVATFGVGCFFGGVAWQRRLDKPVYWGSHSFGTLTHDFVTQEMVMPDGEVWERKGHFQAHFSGWTRSGKLSADETQALANEMQSE